MSQDLLAKLKIKPIPKLQESLEIKVKLPSAKQEIKIKTKIIDRSKDENFDRRKFLEEINEVIPIKSNIGKKQILESKVPIFKEPSIMKDPMKLSIKLKLEESTDPVLEKSKKTKDEKPTSEKKERKTKFPIGIPLEGPSSLLVIGDTLLNNRLNPESSKVIMRASSYYMNNREIFINSIYSILGEYSKDIAKDETSLSCNKSDSFSLLTHQKIVRDYINLYTPYRGLLLYHGLGSGKTCSSIAISEGLKSDRKIIIMTPASLQMNYQEELKKCGDQLYKKTQYWEFINSSKNEELSKNLAYVLSIPYEFIQKNKGAWMINVKKKSNYDSLSSEDKVSLDQQITLMIKNKYQFINYNGMRKSHLQNLSLNNTINPFDNTVVIIDEAHNLVSRIVNKLKSKSALSLDLYEYLMTAENAKIILLTGTPIINYPNEIGILFNILRGKIKTFKFRLNINSEKKINQESFIKIFKNSKSLYKIMDIIEYQASSNTLTITQNPFGFISVFDKEIYKGVQFTNESTLNTKDFISAITKILLKYNIQIVPGGSEVNLYKALPDTLDEFKKYFIDDKNLVKNENLFKRRILGLTSYFPDIEALLPAYNKGMNFHIINIPMSDFQFNIYEEARIQERKLELANSKKRKQAADGIYDDSVSTYRIFSRAFCNFIFPRPDILRPFPNANASIESAISSSLIDEDAIDAISLEKKALQTEGIIDIEDAEESIKTEEVSFDPSYENRIKLALKELKKKSSEFLTKTALEIYSPKFLNILENIQDPKFIGLHLIYSQFRILEGIGILKLILEQNNFAHFKIIKNTAGSWQLDIPEEDKGKPMFALYTGTESREEKEIIRNIFNGAWDFIPKSISDELKLISNNNNLGEIIKVLMITASGAEGISLRNVRYVHITEPYWHPVRIEQVIGRARRICSHEELEKELRTVDVFLYLMNFSEKQLNSDDSIELRLKDKSKIDNLTPLTSDQALYEISTIKENINKSILKAVKESAIDCMLYLKADNKEDLSCFSFGNPNPNKLAFQPSIDSEESDAENKKNERGVSLQVKKVRIEGIEYAYDPSKGDLYDYKSFKAKNPIKIGKLEINGKNFKLIKL